MKQVIVMRKDLNMRKGKMCAQSGHACIGALEEAFRTRKREHIDLWEQTGTKKVCVGVESLEELRQVQLGAAEAQLPLHVVTDSGLTEFKEPTVTCLAIGPAPDEEIDKITGHLRLL